MTRDRAFGRLRAGGAAAPAPAPAFSPATIAYTSGVWLDPSDLATGFTDGAGTVPQTASGDATGRRSDKSGNAKHFTSSGSLRPIYTVATAIASDNNDGLDDKLTSVALTLGADMDFFMAIYREDTTDTILCYADGFTTEFIGACRTSASSCNANTGTLWQMAVDGVDVGTVNTCTRTQLKTAVTPGGWHVVEARNLNLTAANWTNLSFGNYPSIPSWSRVGGLIVCPAQTSGVRAQIRTWLGAKVGKTL